MAVNGKMPLDFPRRARLRTSADYQAVFGEGKRFSTSCFRLHVVPRGTAASSRLGIAVSKRVDKLSPGRNRIKRQVREFFRLHRASVPCADFVFVAKPPAAAASNALLRSELETLLQRVRTLPPVDVAGTMPALEATASRRHPDNPDPS